VPALSFLDARSTVLRQVRQFAQAPQAESVPLIEAMGRVLTSDILADRDYPPFNRAMRDGFAVRSADIPGRLHIAGEIRAGQHSNVVLQPGEAIEIMTGAPAPQGSDAVVMIEHTALHDDGTVSTEQSLAPGANIAARGSEARAASPVLRAGMRLGFAEIGWLAATGNTQVAVARRPAVAILPTGDEIVDTGDVPETHQIRNSNSWSLAAQVTRAGGIPRRFPIAPDNLAGTRALIETALSEADLLLLSGGVSAGKYDVVEPALAELGAEFYFDRVLLQPGAPCVFGRVAGKFFFGLPGNPASTMVTFEIFARAALDLLSGAAEAPLDITLARLTEPFSHKAGFTRFLPAIIRCSEVTPVTWQGSGDIPAICRANGFLVADPATPSYAEGDLIPVLMK
jgi:molybdopterin molybdotransferase